MKDKFLINWGLLFVSVMNLRREKLSSILLDKL